MFIFQYAAHAQDGQKNEVLADAVKDVGSLLKNVGDRHKLLASSKREKFVETKGGTTNTREALRLSNLAIKDFDNLLKDLEKLEGHVDEKARQNVLKKIKDSYLEYNIGRAPMATQRLDEVKTHFAVDAAEEIQTMIKKLK